MIVEPIKATITTMATISAGGATVLTEGTLIPIGIFMSGVVILTTAAWKISAAIQRQADAMSMMDLRISVIERRCRSCNHKELK